jgi:hypothetical protein
MSWYALLAARDARRQPMGAQEFATALTPLGFSSIVNACALQLQLRSAQSSTQARSCSAVHGCADGTASERPTPHSRPL